MSTSIETRSDCHRIASGAHAADPQTHQPVGTRATRHPFVLDRLRALAEEIRHAVVQATLSTDLDAKLLWWSRYQTARAQAMALLRQGMHGQPVKRD